MYLDIVDIKYVVESYRSKIQCLFSYFLTLFTEITGISDTLIAMGTMNVQILVSTYHSQWEKYKDRKGKL